MTPSSNHHSAVARFDDALPTFVRLALSEFGEEFLDRSLILRDANGRLTLIIRGDVDQTARKRFEAAAEASLGAYVSGPTATPQEIFDESLQSNEGAIAERVLVDGSYVAVQLVDRRIIGQDWNQPHFTSSKPPLAVFYSVKGGVGRTTALAVAAAAFSHQSKNILVIDLDLEAPGLASVMLPIENLPKYGALDYFVENGLNGVDDRFLEDCISPSPLTAGRGLVEIVPAVGRIGRKNPQNVLPKLGRAFLDDLNERGAMNSFGDQARELVKAFTARRRYDAVFVDARAGLSESTSAAIMGLGGEILMFGVDTPQTFDGYSYLLAHLGRFAKEDKSIDDWRSRLRMIHAKADRGVEALSHFRDQAQEVFSTYIYEEASPGDFDAFNFDLDDPDAPHFAWPIPYDAAYAEFDPAARREQLTREFFDRTFGPFVNRLADVLFGLESTDGGQ